jgi:transposase
MPLPYSDDLRMKLLEAYEAGAGSLRQLAIQFRVSWGYTKKIRMQQLQTGGKARVEQKRRGYPSRIGTADRERLCAWLREQPDLHEEELRQRLAATGVAVCASRIGQLLRQMGMRRKKSRSTRRSATPRPTSDGASNSGNRSAPSRRNG